MRNRIVFMIGCLFTGAAFIAQDVLVKRNPAGIEWIFVKGGTFQMGDASGSARSDEKPVHPVTVSDFYMGKTEVTVAQYRVFCKVTGRKMASPPPWGWQEDHPIVNVSWLDAKAFCDWSGCRLPTEAEWEYAAKGGIKSKGYKYSGSNTLDAAAWYEQNSSSKTQSVKTKQPNEIGLYDMSGNAHEWCSDWKGNYVGKPQKNPKGPDSGSERVLRGGCYSFVSGACRTSARDASDPGSGGEFAGFRCARVP